MANKPKIYQCRYSHCKHEVRDILDGDDFVLVGKSTYYHADCYKELEVIKEIIDVFSKEVNENVVFASLRRTIDDIIYKKGKSPEFLLFGLKYFIKYKHLNYPGGLYYVIQDIDVQRAWERERRKKIELESKEMFSVTDQDIDRNNNIILPTTRKNSFESIIGV